MTLVNSPYNEIKEEVLTKAQQHYTTAKALDTQAKQSSKRRVLSDIIEIEP